MPSITPPPVAEALVSLGKEQNQARLTVSDTGPGISPEDLPHVFERFYRGDKFSRVPKMARALGWGFRSLTGSCATMMGASKSISRSGPVPPFASGCPWRSLAAPKKNPNYSLLPAPNLPFLTTRKIRTSPLPCFLTFLAILLLTLLGPAEKSLGGNVRLVYLHGAWVLGCAGSFRGSWPAGAGCAALSPPISLCLVLRPGAHRFNFLDHLSAAFHVGDAGELERLVPGGTARRLALGFAIGGLLLQIGLALAGKPAWTALGNLFFCIVLLYAVTGVQNIMHPGSPIFSSEALLIQVYFISLFLLTLLATFWVALWLKTRYCQLSFRS